MILVLGGTSEGREIAGFLAQNKFQVMLSVTTSLAKSFVKDEITVRVGKLTPGELEKLLQIHSIDTVIDATHPFAEQISEMAFKICQDLKVSYLRYERPEANYPENILFAKDFKSAVKLILAQERVFAAIGVRHLLEFITSGGFKPENIYVRVLPSSLKECLALGVPRENIFTGIGPFSYEENHRHFSASQAKWLVTKASGSNGGEEEKIASALDLGMYVIVVKRPFTQGDKYYDKEEILQRMRGMKMTTGLIILAHGSKRVETKQTLAEIVELIKQKGSFKAIEEAYLQFCDPTLEDAVKKHAQKGIKNIVIMPYFLFKGIHNTEDIPNEIARLQEIYPETEITLTEPLGVDERLAQIVIDRVKEVPGWNF